MTPWTAAHQAPLSTTISQSLFKLMSIKSVMPSNHLFLCCSLLLLPSVFPSIMVFSNESAFHIRWPEYWSFRLSPSNEYSGLISFRTDWFVLLATQRTLKSLLQHHNLKASILWCLAFFMVQLWHPYMTTGKPTALTIQIFVGKVMSLLFNTLSRFVIAFLARSKRFLISLTGYDLFGIMGFFGFVFSFSKPRPVSGSLWYQWLHFCYQKIASFLCRFWHLPMGICMDCLLQIFA